MTGRAAAAAALLGGTALLLWPAWALNGYPIVLSDTGAFLAQTVQGWRVWDKPLVYGPAMHALHWRGTLWGPALAQGMLLSWLLWLTARVVRGGASPAGHLLLCAGLAALTAAPWFASLLMPDPLAPAMVLALFLLGFAEGHALSRAERLSLGAVAALAAAAHLSHLPVAAALVLLVAAARRRWRPALACAAPLAAALAVLLATNLAAYGRVGLSPYGAVFALARLVADGPAARTVAARCPEAPGWHLCAWAGRLPADSDVFLWSGDGPVWAPRADGARPGGPISLAPEAAAIVAETLAREPLAVLRAAAVNALRQIGMARVGDGLVPDNLAAQVGRQLALGFPAAEQRRFAGSLQARGLLPPAAAPFLAPHGPVLLLGGAAALMGLRRAAVARDRARLGLVLCVLVGVAANAAATGALSGPHDRYQARIAWLLPLAAALALAPWGGRPRDEAPRTAPRLGRGPPASGPEDRESLLRRHPTQRPRAGTAVGDLRPTRALAAAAAGGSRDARRALRHRGAVRLLGHSLLDGGRPGSRAGTRHRRPAVGAGGEAKRGGETEEGPGRSHAASFRVCAHGLATTDRRWSGRRYDHGPFALLDHSQICDSAADETPRRATPRTARRGAGTADRAADVRGCGGQEGTERPPLNRARGDRSGPAFSRISPPAGPGRSGAICSSLRPCRRPLDSMSPTPSWCSGSSSSAAW